jgi:N-methylhydantoinase A
LLLDVTDEELAESVEKLAIQGKEALVREGVLVKDIEVLPSVDVRYRGQSYAINIDWQGAEKTTEAFHCKHEKLYGHRLDQAVELVTLRIKAQKERAELTDLYVNYAETNPAVHSVTLVGIEKMVPVYTRENLVVGKKISGPALITEIISTTYIAPGWNCELHQSGSLLLTHK